MINSLNYFKTKEKAERALFEQNLRLKLRKFAEDNNDKIDWGDYSGKYYIFYNHDKDYDSLDVGDVYEQQDYGQIYFSSKETAEKAIEEFREDLIRYFTTNK